MAGSGERAAVVPLRKIDCVMVRVADLPAAVDFYAARFGLRPLWRDEVSAGMGLPETDAEIVLHTMDLPPEWGVHYLVTDVRAAASAWRDAGLALLKEPFEVAIGWCAVLADPSGNPICLLDLTNGPRGGPP